MAPSEPLTSEPPDVTPEEAEEPTPLQVMGLHDAEFTDVRAAEEEAETLRTATHHAPSVVAVVVTCDAGDWFEEVLESLRDQDYPNLSVLVLDAGVEHPAAPRVDAVLPTAHVQRIEGNPGFAPAANELLDLVAGASFYAICHDDVHLAPDAIRILVEEAFRSNAGVVGPKLVSWDDPAILLQVGESADKTGVVAPLVERGELDQEQHDAVRDVFAIPGGCTLVRAELFEALRGFDPAMTFLGEDLDLCWRAQVAGARVVVAPGAVVRHREALTQRRAVDDRRRLQARHRLRSVLTCYGPLHLARVLPWAVVLTVVESSYALVTGHVIQAWDVLAAWTWNLRRLSELRRRRRLVRESRQLHDGEVRRLQVRGSARITAYVRGELGGATHVRSIAGLGRGLTGSVAAPSSRLSLGVWLVLVLVLVVGSRDLLGERVPAVGSLNPFTGPLELLRAWTSGFRDAGLGAVGPSPTAFGLLGLGGIVLLGQMGALQQLLVLGTVPLGLLGVWRLARPFGSRWTRVTTLVVYAATPLPYHALAEGSWATLAVYAAAPWLLGFLLRAAGEPPFGDGATTTSATLRRTAGLGILVALVGALVPLAALLAPLVAVALLLGALLDSTWRGALRGVAVAGGAAVVALVLHLPWSVELLRSDGTWWALGGLAPLAEDRVPVTELLRFGSGTAGTSALRWATLVAAAVPLVLGRGWRFSLAVRLWSVALVCWGVAFASGAGWLGVDLPPASLLLVPGAVAVALAVGLAVATLEADLDGERTTWRRPAVLATGAAVVFGLLPALAGAVDGRWGTPEADFAVTLGFTEEPEVAAAGAHRVLWVGHPASLPVGAQELADGLAFGISNGGSPDILERWAPPEERQAALAGDALRLAAAGQTEHLGRLLAPLGIRYLALPASAAPERADAVRRPLPAGLLQTASLQLDLRAIPVDGALTLYENTVWAPVRLQVAAGGEALTGSDSPVEGAAHLELAGAEPVLPEDRHLRYEGEVDAGTVYVAEGFADRWRLEVDGAEAPHVPALGWANAFEVAEGGDATLRYRTSPLHWFAVLLQVGLWVAALVFVARRGGAAAPVATTDGAEP